MTDTCQQAGTCAGAAAEGGMVLRASSSWPRAAGTPVLSIHRAADPRTPTTARTWGSSEKVSTVSSMARSPRSKWGPWGGGFRALMLPTYLLPTQFSSHCQLRLCTMPWAAFNPARPSPPPYRGHGVVVQAPLPSSPPHHLILLSSWTHPEAPDPAEVVKH